MDMSTNGIIAYKDGNEDFLPNDGWTQLVNVANKTGAFIWGRRTYDLCMELGDKYFKDFEKNVKKIVISHTDIKLKRGFESANSPEDAIKILEGYGIKEVILSGGSKVNSSFAKANLIDEVFLYINPIVVGEGIPVFNPENFNLNLKLISTEKRNKDLVELHYNVIK